MDRLKSFIVVVVALMLCAGCSSTNTPIKSVIITGQNNHNWSVSHLVLEQILEGSSLFEVDLAISPKKGESFADFNVDFDHYDLVVLDYTGDDWNTQMQQDFLEYVKGGGGVVVYHAANNAFKDWKEYSQITALGGWGGRTKESGDWLYVKNGEIVRDPGVDGRSGSHGPRHDFVVKCYDDTHLITKGLPQEWLQCNDELYDQMRGPGEIKSLLYTAYSDSDKRGTGREEPMMFTVEYGKGRIFHTMLGHCDKTAEDNVPMQSVGFQVTLLRGAEWAATGRVTQPVPDDMSTKEETKLRKNYIKE